MQLARQDELCQEHGCSRKEEINGAEQQSCTSLIYQLMSNFSVQFVLDDQQSTEVSWRKGQKLLATELINTIYYVCFSPPEQNEESL